MSSPNIDVGDFPSQWDRALSYHPPRVVEKRSFCAECTYLIIAADSPDFDCLDVGCTRECQSCMVAKQIQLFSPISKGGHYLRCKICISNEAGRKRVTPPLPSQPPLSGFLLGAGLARWVGTRCRLNCDSLSIC